MLYNTNIVYNQKLKLVSQRNRNRNVKLSTYNISFIEDTLDLLTEPCIGKLSKLLHNQSFTLEALSSMKFKKRLSYARYHQGKNKPSSMIVIVR